MQDLYTISVCAMSGPYHACINKRQQFTHLRPFFSADIAYIIGGSTDPSDSEAVSYEVTMVNLKTGEVGQAKDTLHATHAAAAASSLTRIAVCGGKVLNSDMAWNPAKYHLFAMDQLVEFVEDLDN